MRLTGTALRLTIMVGESDRWHHKPLFTQIVHRAHRAGLAGATVLHGIEGFGASSRIHTSRLLSLSEDLPVVIVIVDTHDRIHAFLPELDELVTEGLVVLEDCHVIRYVGRSPGDPDSAGNAADAAGDEPGRAGHEPDRGGDGPDRISPREADGDGSGGPDGPGPRR